MKINKEIKNIAEAIKQAIPVERIYLFGSYAYGAPGKDSDYDLFVVLPNGGLRPLEAAQKAHIALIGVNAEKPVDILTDYRSRFDDRRQYNTLERKVFEEGVVLYERA